MPFRISGVLSPVMILGSLLSAAPYAHAQKVVVDSDHELYVFAFSSPRILKSALWP